MRRFRLSWRAQWFGFYSLFAAWAPMLYFVGWWRDKHGAVSFELWRMSWGEWAWAMLLLANGVVLMAGLIETARATEQ